MNYNQVLTEAAEYFADYGINNIYGSGFYNIVNNDALFEQYLDAMTAGMSDNSKAQTKQLMKNSTREVLTEANTTGLAPIYAMSNPLIRMLWPKLHLKEAIHTVVADSPKLLLTYITPYVISVGADGKPNKHYIPYEYDDAITANGDFGGALGSNYEDFVIDMSSSQVVSYDLWKEKGEAKFGNVASAIKFQNIDSDFLFKSITLSTGDEVKVGLKPSGVNGTLIYDFTAGDPDVTTGKVIVTVDYKSDVIVASYIITSGTATVKAVKCRAHWSTEYHENVTTTGLETHRTEVEIGTADHISATVPAEFLSDLEAMYKIKGTEQLTSSMSKLVELHLDKRIAKFIADAFVTQPGDLPFYKHLGDNSQRFAVFNAKPPVNNTQGARAYRDEIRLYIDDLAARIEIATYLEEGVFNVVCNPKDAQLINNVNWTMQGGMDQVDGVSVSYNVGTYKGTHLYKVISSPQIEQGYIYILFIPSQDNQLTYVYYPYSFVMESNYRDPNRTNVPSLMTTKRDAMKSVLPAIACLQVLNNGSALSGSNVFDIYREYMPTKATTIADSEDDANFVNEGTLPSGK